MSDQPGCPCSICEADAKGSTMKLTELILQLHTEMLQHGNHEVSDEIADTLLKDVFTKRDT